MARDNFSANTTRILAERVGYLCSNPKCRAHTVGPNKNSEKSTKIGEAAHITAASEGGPRYDSYLKPGQRTNIENGIWLCSNCADLIDKDAGNYSLALLKKWKADSELEMYEKINGSVMMPIDQLKEKINAPFLEVDLRYNSSGRWNRGYSDKNPIEKDEYGNLVRVLGFANSPIIFWKIDWEFSLLIYNNSTQPVFNVQIKPITAASFTKLQKLPKINNLHAMGMLELSAEYATGIESNHIDADKLLSKRIPEALDGSQFEITYQDENRSQYKTIVSIKGLEIINERG